MLLCVYAVIKRGEEILMNNGAIENISISLKNFPLPKNVTHDNEYYESLCKVLDEYINYILTVHEIGEDCNKNIFNNCECIKRAIAEYYNADFSAAENLIRMVIKKYINSPFIVSEMNENYAFKGIAPKKIQPSIYKERYKEFYKKMQSEEIVLYRARSTSEKMQRKDMLHIPFDKREKVTTQRFSMPGIPCLYLATTSFGAWMEIGMPELKSFKVSAVSLPKELKILNLCQQQLFIDGSATAIKTEEERKNFYDFLEIFPLVIATSYRVLDDKRNFKSEYIISQLIMQAARKLKIDGVAYLSKKIDDYFAYPQCVNLAILIPYEQKNDTKYWSRIDDVFLTEPYCIQDMDLKYHCTKETFINKFYSDMYYHNKIKMEEKEFKYSELNFAKFDNYLLEKERKKVTRS